MSQFAWPNASLVRGKNGVEININVKKVGD